MSADEKARVLVADDDPKNLLAYEAILESLDVEIVKANSGEQALKCLLRDEFAVILLDIQMPGMDGFETATLVRQRQKSQQTPLIFATATYKETMDVFKGYSLGAVDYLSKPMQPEILRSKVAVFVELFKKTAQVKRQAEMLGSANAALQSEIEQHKRTALELNQARDAADAASRSKSEFLANMSHEIRTPMNGIIGMTELALRTELTQEQWQFLNMVKMSADSLLTVINDILDFSKIEAGKLDLDPINFTFREVVGDTLKPFELRAREKNLELAYRVASDVPDQLVGDPGRLRQIIVNLVGNAFKFTERGEVVVAVAVDHAPPVDGVISSDSCLLHFTVTDTGIGIPQSKLQSIFDPFVQADGSTARKYGGTGLGLSISSKLVGMMQGRIWAESKIGGGSTFHFTVVLGVQRNAQAGSPTAEHAQSSKCRACGQQRPRKILLAEDNVVNQTLAVKLLQKDGHQVVLACNGRQAVSHWEQQEFDLVLMDIQMPELDGFEATAAIREREQASSRHTPIIAMTAHAMKGDRELCLNAGMDDYISKPIRGEQLCEVIERVTSSHEPSAHEMPSSAPEPADLYFDRANALTGVSGDEELLKQIVTLFLDETKKQMSEMREAIASQEPTKLMRSAHTLKGNAGVLATQRVVDSAFKLEAIGRSGDLTNADLAFQDLENNIEKLTRALENVGR